MKRFLKFLTTFSLIEAFDRHLAKGRQDEGREEPPTSTRCSRRRST
jgi:hypothetical protein